MGKMQKTSPAAGSCSTSTDVQEDRKPITLMKLMNSHPHRYQGVFSFEFTNKFELKSQSEPSMPDSPDSNSKSQTSTSPGAMPLSNAQAQGMRAVPGTSAAAPPVNGMHSPSSVNGAPSPPNGVSTSSSQQQLPPACGARQLSKLKRFLTTLQQFGSDISPEIGERVRGLVMGLVNSQLSIEEFHQKLQEATNFPLRPFVIPFLKANLPLLQRELLHCARMAKQTPAQYLSQNEHILLNTDTSPVDSSDIIMDVNENGKRRTPDRPKENGVEPMDDPRHPAKRHCTVSPGQHRVSPGTSAPHPSLHGHHPLPPPHHQGEGYMRDMPHHPRESRDHRDPRDPRDIRSGSGSGQQSKEHDREHFEGRYPVHPRLPYDPREYERGSHRMYDSHHPNGSWEDEWKHVEQMLHCVAGMVDKTLRAIASLRHRSVQEREEMLMWSRRCAEGADHEMKKRAGEMMAHTIRQTEDRVSEVKRRAEMYQAQMARTFPFYNRPRPEEAVNEVKRQAVIELQKAVAAAEQKASELVAAERAKMERAVADARRQAQDEANQQQESSSENCWNCGRKASETCSGCNVARYCGSFCQHKDWENHHRICGTQALQQQAAASTDAAAATTSATTPPTVASPVESVKSVTTTTSRSGSPVEKAEAR